MQEIYLKIQQNEHPNVNGYDWCILMHKLPTCQNQHLGVNCYVWCASFQPVKTSGPMYTAMIAA